MAEAFEFTYKRVEQKREQKEVRWSMCMGVTVINMNTVNWHF